MRAPNGSRKWWAALPLSRACSFCSARKTGTWDWVKPSDHEAGWAVEVSEPSGGSVRTTSWSGRPAGA